jgi:PAS domain S-box-containing protein
MADRDDSYIIANPDRTREVTRFTEQYASFNRIINSLQRKYIELREDFSSQNERLAETNRKLVEMTARNLEATEFLNGILQSISAGVIAVNQHGRITHFNPAAAALLRIPAGEVIGRIYRDIIPPGEPSTANALRSVETGRVVEAVDKQIELSDGTRLHLSISTAIVRDDSGRPTGAVEVFHDLTKVKRMEEEIARLNTLAALGEMAATIAHQVRNPLAGIGGFAALLKRDLPADDSRQKTTDKIIRGVENLNRTVNALLDYTKSEQVNREELSCEDFLRATVKQFQHEHGDLVSGIQFDIEPPARAVPVSLDPHLCRQLFFNLFINAIEACNGQGRISLACELLSRQAAVSQYAQEVSLDSDETAVQIVVADSGPGVDETALDSAFSPFFTTKPGGTGLGLAVVWKIVKAHAGHIWAANAADGGARFTLLLPLRIRTLSTDAHVKD